jgi:hypothetical protein
MWGSPDVEFKHLAPGLYFGQWDVYPLLESRASAKVIGLLRQRQLV